MGEQQWSLAAQYTQSAHTPGQAECSPSTLQQTSQQWCHTEWSSVPKPPLSSKLSWTTAHPVPFCHYSSSPASPCGEPSGNPARTQGLSNQSQQRAHEFHPVSLSCQSLATCQAFLTMEDQFYLNSHLCPIFILKMSYISHCPRTKTTGDERFSQTLATHQTIL